MSTPLLIEVKDFPEQTHVPPPVRINPWRRCLPQVLCAFACTASMFATFYFSYTQVQHVQLDWQQTDLNWKSQNTTFTVRNDNWFKDYSLKSDSVYQVFWYCKDLTAVVPECDWVPTQTLTVPHNKADQVISPRSQIHFHTINTKWDKHIAYWPEMVEACKYGLLMIFWNLGDLRTRTYDVCAK